MLSDIQALPSEILGEIFIACLPEHDVDRIQPTQAPMLLCQICSSWRSLAMGNSFLWDTIILPSEEYEEEEGKLVKFVSSGGVQRWFGLTSPGHLLSFGEEGFGLGNEDAMVQITILNIVSTYASRLKHLSLVLYHSHYFALLDGVHFEELESVSVHSSTDALDLGLVRMPTPFNSESSPKLHEASFSLIDVPPLSIDLPWGQLTIVDAGLPYGRPLGFPEWRAFWTQCPNIKQATFVLPWEFTRRYSNLDAFSYPSLTKLTLVIPPSPLKRKELWTIFAGPAVFTNLEHLQLNLCHGRESSNPLLHRLEAFSKLKSISIQGCNSFDDDSLEYPMEAKTLVHDLVKQFHSLRPLNHLFMPYHYMDSNDIASLLHSHSPTSGYPGLNVTIDAGSIENVGIWKRKLEGERFSSIASRVELVSWEQNVIYSGHLASRSVSASSAQFASNYAKLPFH